MLITKIIAKNFKTYRELDLDLSVNEEQPIILIGGENGGGKTTLFQAIYSALYGLKVKDELHFNKLQNAGERAKNSGNSNNKIELEIHFTGKVLQNDYKYIIKRLYTINAQNNPVEAVMLNLNGAKSAPLSVMLELQYGHIETCSNIVLTPEIRDRRAG